jgi:hypothetical protein
VTDGAVSPYLTIIERAGRLMVSLSDRLGFSPVARARPHVEPPEAPEEEGAWGALKRFPVIEGGRSEAQPAMRPWEAEGVSRATFYRRKGRERLARSTAE